MNLEQVNNSADQKEANEAKQTQNRIPESPKAKQSSSNALTSLDKEDNAQDSTNSNDNAGQASETSKDQDSNLELNQDSKPESNKPSSGSKPDSDKDSDSKSTNPPASLGEGKPGENSNPESKSGSEQKADIDPADTKESEPNQAADSTKGSQTNPDQTSSVKSTAEQADQTVPNPTDSSPVSTKAANEIRTSITAALKQSLQTKSVQTNSQVEDESKDQETDTNKNSTVTSSPNSNGIESDNALDSISNSSSNTISTSNTEIVESTATKSSFETELTDLTSNPSIQVVQFETNSFSEYVAIVTEEMVYDFTQKVEAEDGAKIKVSWNEGTFETDEVVFQAKKADLTEDENEKMDSHLDQGQNYYVRVYDLSFFKSDNTELKKIEPSMPVKVGIEFPEIQKDETVKIGESAGVFHFKEDGSLEVLEDTSGAVEESEDDPIGIMKTTENSTKFLVDSFSKFAFPYNDISETQWYKVYDADGINKAIKENFKFIRLEHNLFNQVNQVVVSKDKDIVLDMNGFALENRTQSAIKVEQGGKLVITNRTETQENGTTAAHWGTLKTDNNNSSVALYSKDYISYKSENGSQIKVENAGIVTTKEANQAAIEIYDSKSILEIQRGVGITSDNGTGIKAFDASTITLGECYICHNQQSGVVLHEGPTLNVNDGAIISMNTGSFGAGIYADSTRSGYPQKKSSTVNLNSGSLISYNKAGLGGGICIGENKEFCDEEAHDTTGFETANATEYSKLLMRGGTIVGNIATLHEGGGIALRFNSGARGVLTGGVIKNNQALNNGYKNQYSEKAKDWGGGGVFASQGTFLWMPNGADITNNAADGLGGGLTGCSTGKIILDPSLNIYNNQASGVARTSGSDKPKDAEYLNKPEYTHDNWQGADIFGAEKTQVTGPIEANFEGLAGTKVVRGSGGATIRSDDWLVLENLNKSGSSTTHNLKINGNYSTTHGGGVLINGWLITGASQLKMFGDDIGLIATKKLQNIDGIQAVSTREFKFKITDSLENAARTLSTGTVNGNGAISFSNRLVVNPEEILSSSLGVNNTTTLDYYLSEDQEDTATVNFDKTVYKLHFTIKCISSTTVSIPYWNPETEAFENKSVTIEEYQIDSLQISEQNDSDKDFGTAVEVAINGTPKSVDLSTVLGHSATFTNTLINEKKIGVEKTWADENNLHLNDYVTVYLKRYLAGQSEENAEIVKAITLNSNEYKGTATLPNGVNGEFAGKGIWKKTWDEEFPVASGNSEYVYLVEEECSNKLYAGTITSSTAIIGGNTPDTTEVDALVPVPSMIKGQDYFIVSPFKDQMLNVSNYTKNNEWWITPDHKIGLTNIDAANSNDPIYKIPANIDTYKIRYSDFDTGGKTGGLVVHPGDGTNEGWIYANNDGASNNKGLMISHSTNYKNSNTKGYQLISGYLQIQTGNDYQDVTYSHSSRSFGTKDKNDGQGVKLYQIGKATISTGSFTGGSATENFVITNSKADNLKFTLNVIKVDSQDDKKFLSGAEFKLSRIESGSTTEIEFTGSNGSYSVKAANDSSTGTKILVTPASGKISISNLPIGTYELEETKAPDGYALPYDENDRKQKIEISGESTELVFRLNDILNNRIFDFPLDPEGFKLFNP